ncbi:conserved hypothetical protein [Uncinocarpus reesii 1704]|uniref:Aminodeoxychorismate lyase n=1 Tax=Uncinocarpus reesii (strain UAMH 1704) TaxID=336963 RepID=C4JWV2_UNCRE|nr:uncharacterized protein UREG_06125 [Uncinocarpus reesii 1704]EEP81260.1 conserved hypothetical protein [Uncinocarpus reesii 1704]
MSQSCSEAAFQIISSLRFDPALPNASSSHNAAYYLFPYHYDRLLAAATDFQWTLAVSRLQERGHDHLLGILDREIPSPSQPWRIRLLMDETGEIKSEFTSLAPSPSNLLLLPTLGEASHPFSSSDQARFSPRWVLRLDSQPTTPSLFTRHKTTRRGAYDASRARAGIRSSQEAVEVLIYSVSGEVMEGSITTPYFKRSRRRPGSEDLEEVWVTPPLSSGGNAGTTRRFSLATGLCVEEVVGVDDLVDGEEVWLSNGVRGFFPAVLQIDA